MAENVLLIHLMCTFDTITALPNAKNMDELAAGPVAGSPSLCTG